MLDFKYLYFADEVDENDYLSTIGVKVKIDGNYVKGATAFEDLGGESAKLDATKLTDRVVVNVPGVQDYDTWGVTYWFNNNLATSDFRVLNKVLADYEDKQSPKFHQAVEIVVEFADGTEAKNKGLPASNVVSGASVNSMQECVFSLMLREMWTFKDPSQI